MISDSETPPLHRSELVARRRVLPNLAGRLVPNAIVDGDRRFDDIAAGRFATITLTEPSAVQRTEIERCGGVIVIAGPASQLRRWLRRGRTRAALIRPDGTVARTSRDLTVVAEALPRFLPTHTWVQHDLDSPKIRKVV